MIPTLALVDEPHRQKDMGLYRLWKGKLRKRGGQIGLISTAGEPGHEFEEMRDAIRASGAPTKRRDAYARIEFGAGRGVMHEYMVRDAEQVFDVKAVKAANPFSGVTEDSLTEELASETTDLGDWRRLKCNRPTRSTETALSDADYDGMAVDEQIPQGEPVDVGADFAWKWDTTALVPLWVRNTDFRLLGDAEILEPPRDGTTLDPQEVKDAFQRIHDRNPIQMVVMDITKAEDIAAWLENELGVNVVDRSQGNSAAAEEYDRWMEAMSNGWLKHTGDPGLRSHALNAVARKIEGDRHKFDRPSSSRHHGQGKRQNRKVIDALKAASMVHAVALAAPAPKRKPTFEVLA